MHVAFTANGRCIAEFVCYRFDRSAEITLRLRDAVEAFKLISFNRHIEALRGPCRERHPDFRDNRRAPAGPGADFKQDFALKAGTDAVWSRARS